MSKVVTTNTFNKKVLDASNDSSKVMAGADLVVQLFQAPGAFGPDTVLGQLTEANFPGYMAMSGVNWNAPNLQPDGSYALQSDLVGFVATGSSPSNNIAGYQVVNHAMSNAMVMGETFDTPVLMSAADDAIYLSLNLKFSSDNDNGSATVIE